MLSCCFWRTVYVVDVSEIDFHAPLNVIFVTLVSVHSDVCLHITVVVVSVKLDVHSL